MKFLRFLVFGISVLLFSACEKPAKKEAMSEVADAVAAMNEDAMREMEEGGLSVNKPVDNSRLMDALDKAGDASSGQEKIAMNLAKLSVTRMTALAEKLNIASGDLTAGLDYSGVKEVNDLDALSEKIRSYRRANAEVKAGFSMKFLDDLKKEGDRMGLKGRAKADFFSAMGSKFSRQLPVIHKIRDFDDELCSVILKQHALLKRHFGEWSASDDEGLTFETDEGLEAYNALAEKLQSVADDQAAAQQKLISIQ